MMQAIKLLMVIVLGAHLVACATVAFKQAAFNSPLSWAKREQQLQQLHSWQINGAIAGHDSQHAFTANVIWRQRGLCYDINLFGPFGSDMVKLIGHPHQVTLIHANHTISASNIENLLYQQLGWQLPVLALYYWIRGLPANNDSSKLYFDRYHHLIRLQQRGWQIDYRQYAGIVNQIDLPTHLTIRHDKLVLDIVVSKWQITLQSNKIKGVIPPANQAPKGKIYALTTPQVETESTGGSCALKSCAQLKNFTRL